ncbi:hypothetical protein ACER0C_001607 [Sarotherodon galilaeus]
MTDSSPAVTVNLLSINRVNFFREKTITVGCQLPNNQSQWKMMSFDMDTGTITECADPQTSGRLLSCTIKTEMTH